MNVSPRSPKTQSITRRLMASLAVTVLVVSVIAVAATDHVVSLVATRDLAQEADEMLAYLVGTLETPLWSLDENETKTIGKAIANDQSIVRLVIRDESGTVVYFTEKKHDGQSVERSAQIFHRLGSVDKRVGDVSVSLTQSPFKAGNQQLLLFSMLITLLILLSVAIVSIVFIRKSLSRSLNSLDEIASRFASGIYDTSGQTLPYLEFQPFGRTLDQMARQIEAQIRTVKEAEARYRDIFDNAPEGIFQTALDGRILDTNPALIRILGYESRDDLSVNVRDSSIGLYVDPEARGRLLARLHQHGAVAGFEVQFRRKDGQVIWISISARLVRDDAGMPLFIEGFLADINDRKRAEEEVHRLNRELEHRVSERTAELRSANRELETFTYSVSHDLRAPLRHIDGFLGLLKERIAPALDEESRRYMATISNAALRMAALIDDLLSFSRLGRFEMVKTRVDLGDMIRDVIREFEPDTKDRIVHWQLGKLPMVTGDRAMLRAVLVNLISNALKFTRTRAQAEIAIGCLPDHEKETVIFVRDNGVGFDMQFAGKLFVVFEHLHSIDEFKGTGIGLANVRRVIERHGGRTWAEGKVDGGATFYFSLPRVSVEGLPDQQQTDIC